MKFLAIFLIALVASTSAVSLFNKYPINYSANRNIYTVIAQVKAKMAAGGPLDAVIKLLDGIKKEVQDEQSRHDAVAETQKNQCDSEISFRQQEIVDAKNALDAGTSHLHQCEHDLAQDQTNLANNLASQKQNRETLEELINKRRDDLKLYLQRVEDHNNALQAIIDAVEMLNGIFSGEGSFVELATVAKSMLKHSVKVKATKFYAPIASILAQIANKKVFADSAALDKVKALLGKLSDNLRHSLELFQQQETADVETYKTRKGELEAAIAALESEEATLRQSISALENCVATQNQIIQSSNAKLSRNTDFLNKAQSMCDNFVQEHNAASAKR